MYRKKQKSWRVRRSKKEPSVYEIRNMRISAVNQVLIPDNKERARLNKLYNDLRALGEIPTDEVEVFKYLINFFNIVSFFQDEGPLTCRLKKLDDDFQKKYDELIDRFWEAVIFSGRNPGKRKHNWNRTTKGEEVTRYNVYIENDRAFSWMTLVGIKGRTLEKAKRLRAEVVKREIIPFLENNLKVLLTAASILARY